MGLELKLKILEYLRSTESIGGIVEKVTARDPSAGIPSWVLAPWSLEALKQNIGSGVVDEISRMESEGLLELHHLTAEGEPVELISNLKPGLLNVSGSQTGDMKRSVSGMMNMHILSYLQDRQRIADHPVRLEDALFDLKNGVMLPDDFMPAYLMGNIEGPSLQAQPYEIAREIQPFNDVTAIYCYFEYSSQRIGTLSMIYASSNLHVPMARDEMRMKLVNSFTKLQRYQAYGDFEMSRILNQIIFNMERRKMDELKRPLPKQEYISRLIEMGIIREVESKYRVNPHISGERIKQIRDELKKNASKLAKEWLSQNII